MALSKYKHADHFSALHEKKAEKTKGSEEVVETKKIEDTPKNVNVENVAKVEVAKVEVVKVDTKIEKPVVAKSTTAKKVPAKK
ncbi:MAG: hypothetical protein WCG25_00085 [bacterium]